jgi:hypothetical protein
MTTMIASHLALLLALSLIVVVLALLVMAFAAVPLAMALGSTALALGAGYRLLSPGPQRRRRARTPRPLPAWEVTPPTPRDLGGPRWTQAWQTVPPPSHIPIVREQAATVLAEWDICGQAAEPALLVVTELLTNALEHADTPIRVTLELGQALVRVQVHDAARTPPQPHDPPQLRGHGLEIVTALALRQGWTLDPHGKTIWADVPTSWPK